MKGRLIIRWIRNPWYVTFAPRWYVSKSIESPLLDKRFSSKLIAIGVPRSTKNGCGAKKRIFISRMNSQE